ncbi:MAG: ferredoxin reductase family protein [Gemmatimonadota bacterium]
MKGRIPGLIWSFAYVALIVAPLVVLGSGLVVARGAGWWFDFSMGLGFGALALMGGQFLLTARFRRATAPFGMDVLYMLHRWLAVVGLLLVVAHYAILRVAYPRTLEPAWPGSAPFHMTAGRLALAIFVVLAASSLWRKAFGISYDRWRIAHIVLAVAGMVLAFVHVVGVGYHSGLFWTRIVLDLFMGSLIVIVAYVRVMKPIALTARPYRVTEVSPVRGRCWRLRLEPQGHDGFRFEPGQFVWISLGRSPLRAQEHPFSISGSAERAPALELTIKELGDFTGTIGKTEIGTVAYVDGPHGIFTVDRHPSAPGFLMIAGGVGIAPMVGMLRSMADRGDERPVRLVYGTHAWEATPLRDDLEALEARMNLQVHYVFEEPHEGWEGAVGWPTPEFIRKALSELPDGAQCFMCGPQPLTDMAQDALVEAGVPLRSIHSELFQMA